MLKIVKTIVLFLMFITGGITLQTTLAAHGDGNHKHEEKQLPGAETIEGVGERLCNVGTTADVDGLLDIIVPPMLGNLKKMVLSVAEESVEGAPPEAAWTAFKEEIKRSMTENPLESCEVIKSEQIDCADDLLEMFKQAEAQAPEACGVLTMKTKMKLDEEKPEEEIVPVAKVDGRWYLADLL